MLPTLLRKAAGDAGFDLELGTDAGWQRLGVSGLQGVVWVQPSVGGALLAVPLEDQLAELDAPPAGDVAPQLGSAGAVVCASPGDLYRALRRVRVLLAQAPPRLETKWKQHLAALSTTEVDAVVKQRVGQDIFREALFEYWEGRCAVTGLDVPELLRASHAKPWKDASDAERLDPYNGLLLAVHLDALFDAGLVCFDDAGAPIISPEVPAGALEMIGLAVGVPSLRRVAAAHQPYLAYHREHVFRG